jgi:hypothetical protein
MAVRKSHGFGIGSGSIIDNGNGTVSYRKSGTITTAFTVRVSDVTGFSTSKSPRHPMTERQLTIYGHGTDMASVSVASDVPTKIESWIRAHPDFRGEQAEAGASTSPPSVADELAKLAQLRDSDVLSDEEFAAQKAKLLGHPE